MVMIDETEGIEFDSDGRGCSVTLLTEDGQSLRGLADRAGIWTELEERHPGLTPERILQGDHAVFGCIVIHDNLRAHGEFGMEFDGDAAFGRFELTDVELNMLGKKLPRLADTDELKAFFSHAGGEATGSRNRNDPPHTAATNPTQTPSPTSANTSKTR